MFLLSNRLCIACDVPTGESDFVKVYCGRSQRAVLHDVTVNSMSLAFAVPISLDAFGDFVQRLRKCQLPLSVTSVLSEAVCFVICTASALFLLNSSLLVCTRTSYYLAYHEIEFVYRRGVSKCTFSMAKAKQCPTVFAVCLKSLTANVTADILICVVVCARSFATHERQDSLL